MLAETVGIDMAAHHRSAVEHTQSGVLNALAHPRRRMTLSLLDRLEDPDVAELAVNLAADEAETIPLQVDPTAVEQARIALEHCHLPKLVEQDLVTWEDGRVTTTSHPALDDPTVETVVESESSEWDDVLAALADTRQCAVLTAVAAADGPMDRQALAGEIADRLSDDYSVDEAELDLHHSHLPALEDAGLVTYDAAAETVSYDGHPVVNQAWLEPDEAYTRRSFLAMPA